MGRKYSSDGTDEKRIQSFSGKLERYEPLQISRRRCDANLKWSFNTYMEYESVNWIHAIIYRTSYSTSDSIKGRKYLD
jgi:hypothetical protein